MSLPPRDVAAFFAPLHAKLITLLRSLRDDDWQRQTVAPKWRVRDVAGHLVDTQLRKLAGQRDGHRLSFDGAESVLQIINSLNAGGVAFAQRLSPRLLTDLLEVTGPWVAAFVESLDPQADAPVAVLWAGEERSRNWMDTGREYTEWWHHQMQIRDAVGAGSLLLEPRWLEPLLDFSVRALPHRYATVEADEGTTITLTVAAYAWSLTRIAAGWDLAVCPPGFSSAVAEIEISPDTAWRIFYNALPPSQSRPLITARGDERLIAPLLDTRSVMV